MRLTRLSIVKLRCNWERDLMWTLNSTELFALFVFKNTKRRFEMILLSCCQLRIQKVVECYLKQEKRKLTLMSKNFARRAAEPQKTRKFENFWICTLIKRNAKDSDILLTLKYWHNILSAGSQSRRRRENLKTSEYVC